MNFYLIQRGKFKDKINLNEVTGIDSIIDFDYMGSAEFEFGSLPKSLKTCMANYYKNNIKLFNFEIDKHNFICIYFNLAKITLEPEIEKEIVELFTFYKDHPYGGMIGNKRIHLKEMLNINHYFEGHYRTIVKGHKQAKPQRETNYDYVDFWWDIENHFWVFPHENDNLKKINYALKGLEKRGYGKEIK
jgi:hypothetical protein